MSVVVTCPGCSKSKSVADAAAAKTFTCPRCKTSFRAEAVGHGTVSGNSNETLAPSTRPGAPRPEGVPQQVGRYRVKAKLGAGAFGTVYRGHDPQLDRDVALKLLKPEALDSPSAVERFRREAIAAAKMLHANVVPVYEYGEHDGAGYIASAFIEGKSLADMIPEGGLEPRAAVKLMVQLLDALAYAHERGVLHRDVKPANCLVDASGHLFLADFGLAGFLEEVVTRMTQVGAVMGTPAYMPPEQAAGRTKEVGPHSDQYSAGVALYEMLTGSVPFAGSVSVVLFNVIRTQPPKPSELRPDLDTALEAICLKAIAKKPENRYATTTAFAQALRTWLARSKTKVVVASASTTIQKPGAAHQATTHGAAHQTAAPAAMRTHAAERRGPAKTVLAVNGKHEAAERPDRRRLYLVAGCLTVVLAIGATVAVTMRSRPKDRVAELPTAPAPIPPQPVKPDNQEAKQLFQQGMDAARGKAGEVDEAAALGLYKQAASKGHAVATGWVGLMVYHGKGASADRSTGEELIKAVLPEIRRKAEEKDGEAQYLIGAFASLGLAVKQDDKEAVSWYRKAAERGQADAMHALGVALTHGVGTDKNEKEAADWYHKAAKLDHPAAMLALGWAYANELGVKKDDQEAVKWYRMAAERGHAEAACALGVCHATGTMGVDKNETEAAKWYRKAAERGNVASAYALGVAYAHGRGVSQNDKQAVDWYRKASDKGDVKATYSLGTMYASGRGVGKDEKEAVRLWRIAAAKGDAPAMNALGVAHANNQGVDRDDVQAVDWYRKAADKGHLAARCHLGVMYANGRGGLKKDDVEAVRLWREGADKGDPGATFFLGTMYATGGGGLPTDEKKAFELWRAAADKGDASAAYALGLCYENGSGVTKNLAEARKWYEKAAALGHEGARRSVERLGSRPKSKTKSP